MKKLTLPLILAFALFTHTHSVQAQVPVTPTHIVIVVDENHSYTDVIGNANAPTFTALSAAANTAAFTNDNSDGNYPGEPNALEYFSGSIQGVTGDENGPDANAPFNDCNLGSSLIQDSLTFIGYAEQQPRLGWIAYDTLEYITHHIPWINWVGYNTNPDTIPLKCVVPFSHKAPYYTGPIFPDSNGYDSLPTVAIIVPDGDSDMHDGSIAEGDAWFNMYIMPYVRWCNNPANNSIMIVFWEDGGSSQNVPLLVSGAMVQGGTYSDSLDHYDLLRTIEDMYGLPRCGYSDSTGTVDWPVAMWKVTGVKQLVQTQNFASVQLSVYPVPATNQLNVEFTSLNEDKATVSIYDVTGRMLKSLTTEITTGQNYLSVNTTGIANGVYFLTLKGDKINVCQKIEIAN